MKGSKLTVISFIFLLLLLIWSGIATAEELPGHVEDAVVEVYDEDGQYIFSSAMGVSAGDRYINENNKEYEVISVDEGEAVARYTGEVDLLGDGLTVSVPIEPIYAQPEDKKIALYCTHSGESYLPEKAIEDKDRGEIYDVADNLAEALDEKGIKTVVSDNVHFPHDAAAYDRSRRTAVQLERQNRPDAIFDIHRDAIPRKDEYLKRVDGKLVSQVRIVVGRQNPNMQVNLNLAKHLKAVADRLHPGLIRGIFMGKGKYNQDLSSHALLFEFGTHVTTKEEAIASTYMLADAINQLFYGSSAESKAARQEESRSGWKTALWILAIVIGGGIGYLFINEGSLGGVTKRLKNMRSREFGFLGGSKKSSGDGQE
ncbi:MAG: stage II sporulation protein P [Halanaerobium sp.]|nr:stage II sporulation protein P [Halanaerobium sp.]